jgi:site-specific DNA recombinase
MEQIVLYSRVSTQDQNYQSQFDDLRKWAKGNNFRVVETFGEKVSGYDLSAERLEFEKMKAYVLENKIPNIGIWEISRLGRSMVRTLNEIDFFNKHKINVHFKKEGLCSISNNVTNTLLLTILSSMAEMERNSIVDRSIRGRISAAMKGKATNYGIMPYGYTKDDEGMLIVHIEEAKIIKLIYDLGIKGMAVRAIATHLNSLAIPTRHTLSGRKRTLYSGKEVKVLWRSNTVRRILQSKLYKGERTYRDLELKVPSIISEVDWNKVQERFSENVGYINNTKNEYLFKGKLRCGKCGLIYSTQSRNNQGTYYCSGRKDKGVNCKNGGISSSFVDKQLWKALLSYPDFFKSSKNDFENKKGQSKILAQIRFYKSEIEKLEAKKKRIIKLYSDGYYNEDEFRKEQLVIKNSSTEYANNMRVLDNTLKTEDNMAWPKIISNILISKDFNVRRETIENLIDKVLVNTIIETNLKFEKETQKLDKIVSMEIYSYGALKPLKVTLTTRSKNVIIDAKKPTKTIDFNE